MITVIFKDNQRGLCEDLYYCKETSSVYIRQECDSTHVRWLTASAWVGGYEADCCMKEGLVIRVTDKTGRVLFEEVLLKEEGVTGTWADKKGSFSWEEIAAYAEKYENELKLRSYEEWKAWLMADTERCGFDGYPDNWLFAMVKRDTLKKFIQISYLGVEAYVTVQSKEHIACGKRWLCYEIKDAGLDSTLAICGYKFDE